MGGPGEPDNAEADRRARELEEALRAKSEALRELKHRAKSALQIVISLLKLQVNRIHDPEARAAYEQTLRQTQALAIAYRQLHESSNETEVRLDHYIGEVCETASVDLLEGASGVDIEITAEAIVIGLQTAVPVGLIVNELLSAALRHVFGDRAWIRVTLSRTGARRATITVADSGRPLPTGLDTAADSSLMLADALARQLQATLTVDKTLTGTSATLEFPL